MAAGAWYVYLARCADGTLYCGIARDVRDRIAAHDAGRGAKYTRGRGPLAVLITRRCRDHGNALRIEYAVKQLTRRDKTALAADPARLTVIALAVQAAHRRAVRLKQARATARAGAGSAGPAGVRRGDST